MPVRFESASEYKEKFQGPFAPPSERHGFAGLKSEELGNVFEPPLQRRKKPSDVHSSEVFTHQPARDEYVLLGDQSKFAPSVKYNFSHKERDQPRMKLQVPHDINTVGIKGSDPRKRNESNNNAQTKRRVNENCPVHAKNPSVFRPENSSEQPKPTQNGDSESPVDRSPPPAPRPTEDDSYKRKPSNYIPRPTKPSMRNKTFSAPKKPIEADVKVPKLAVPEPANNKATTTKKPTTKPGHYREERSGQMNEFVQTDIAKGVTDSGQEAPANYAMKYRAGIAPPRPRGPKRLSEYQMQYKWKEGLTSSPLIAAEQIVYNSNPHLAPYSNPSVMPRNTEYKSAYKNYEYKPVPIEKIEGTPAKKAKLQRSKSLEVLTQPDIMDRIVPIPKYASETTQEISRPITPDRLRAAGLHSGKRSVEDKRLLRESQNPTRVFFPHGKVKNVGSEYASNFQAPAGFAYEDGAWRGADPPHIQPMKNPIPVGKHDRPKVAKEKEEVRFPPSWYEEVKELRNKAAEYKMRARGTHFSRQHLAQLYAQQADLWDTVSNSSTLSALSLESAGTLVTKKASKPKKQPPVESVTSTDTSSSRDKPGPKNKTREAWAEEGSSPRSDKSTMASSETRSSLDTLVAEEESEEGRVPTPKFRKDPAAEYKWRHHLDRTTPAVGGALLSSPPGKKSKDSGASKSETHVKHDTSTAKVSASWPGPVQTYGLPTRDTHVLVDEEASTDRTLPTKYTHSPTRMSAKDVRPREFDIMPTLRETLRENSLNSAPDDDVLSLSARSVASSCSLASEVLERARNRRDEFWGKPSKKQTRS